MINTLRSTYVGDNEISTRGKLLKKAGCI